MFGPVLEAIQNQLEKTLSELGSGPFPSFGFGEDAIAIQESMPCITWIPIGGPIRRARANGGDGVTDPRALWERAPTIAAHIRCGDVHEIEVLAGHMIAAIHEVTCGSYAMTNESWGTGGTTDNGQVGIFSFELRMPFTREPLGSAVATVAQVTGDIL